MSLHVVTESKLRATVGRRLASADGLILAGLGDGSVSCFPTARWPSCMPVWSCRCHKASVTGGDVHGQRDIAVTGARDGVVILHERVSTAECAHKIVCRVTGEINCVAISADGRHIFVAGDSVRCLTLSDAGGATKATNIVFNVPPPIVSMALTPCARTLAIVSGCGNVGIVPATAEVSAQQGEKFLLRNAVSAAAAHDEVSTLRIAWCVSSEGSGDALLALPQPKALRLLRLTENFTKVSSAGVCTWNDCLDLTSVFIRQVSKFKLVAVAGSRVGKAFVVKLDMAKAGQIAATVSSVYTLPGPLVDLVVDASRGNVVVALESSSVAVLTKLVNSTAPSKGNTVRKDEFMGITGQKRRRDADDGDFDERDEDHMIEDGEAEYEDLREVVTDLIRTNPDFVPDKDAAPRRVKGMADRQPTRSSRKMAFIDDEAEEDEEEEDEEEEDEDDADEDDDNVGGEVFVDNDEGDDASRAHRRKLLRSEPSDDGQLSDRLAEHAGYEYQGRGAFAASLRAEPYVVHLGRSTADADGNQYLCFNAIGAVRRVGHDHVHVQFHDMSRAQVKLVERRTVVAAALGTNFVGLCLRPADDGGSGGGGSLAQAEQGHTVYCRLFTSLGTQSDWAQQLALGELAIHVACGKSYVAVWTSFGYLRMFSLSGLEMVVVSTDGYVVAMTGLNADPCKLPSNLDPLALVLQAPDGALQLKVFDVAEGGAELQPSVPVPVTPMHADDGVESTRLVWVGWGSDGRLYACDSVGVVRCLCHHFGVSWMPVFDPRHLLEQFTLWVWGVVDDSIMAYRCAPGERAPPASVTLPTLERVPMCLPLLRSNTDRHVLQRSQFLLTRTRASDAKAVASAYTDDIAKADVRHDQKLLDMFESALKLGKTMRAIDIATMLELKPSLEVAARKANDMQQRFVTEKVVGLLSAFSARKTKRKCSLPAPGTDVTEKEKDRILRRLLVKERLSESQPHQQAMPATTAGRRETGSAPTHDQPPADAPPPENTMQSHGSRSPADPRKHVTFVAAEDTALLPPRQPSPAKATTATSPAAASPGVAASKGVTVAASQPQQASKQHNFFKPIASPSTQQRHEPAPQAAATSPTKVSAPPPKPATPAPAPPQPARPTLREPAQSMSVSPPLRARAPAPPAVATPPVPNQTPEPVFRNLPIDPFLAPGQDGTRVEGWSTFNAGYDETQTQTQTPSGVTRALQRKLSEAECDDDEDDVPAIAIA